MRKLILILFISTFSSFGFAGMGEGTCKKDAQKAALLLLSLDLDSYASPSYSIKTSVRNNSSIDHTTQWEVKISEDGESHLIYIIETKSYTGLEDSCVVEKIDIQRAG